MRIRAKANGNVLDLPDDEAQPLVDTGIYEEIDESDELVTRDLRPEGDAEPSPKETRRGRYGRRDLRAGE